MAVHSLKQMTDGGWKVASYLDDRATPEQSESLGAQTPTMYRDTTFARQRRRP
jgi:hypothetical protein